LTFSLKENALYGKETFRSQKIICDEIRPPAENEVKPSFFEVENDGSDSMASEIKGSDIEEESSKSTESESETSSVDDIDMDDQNEITDKIAVIQDWLFSNNLPNFSKNEEIIEYISDSRDLEYFFRFVVCPFKAMIHHKVREELIGRGDGSITSLRRG
jgi:predicted  nucleic acid-binding Zn-ribbon protein